ncbi:ankyrin repeat-containing protein 09 [Orientia tsutsugamushi str. Ikeda]|uniref:Ankyrin repeat-containing protein 09 n=1 Tax=Orientia tsutsugamushi (strain Ikeda) TaxID=334380 RepID=B3CQ60_ORITI|nr:ankyrin repeat domain-containing protein [Orientia tsutsugamushi]BAG39756.1 ankyrin repeat-containing protein 09 [Orientia tsutsugamushi str. Ikeda]
MGRFTRLLSSIQNFFRHRVTQQESNLHETVKQCNLDKLRSIIADRNININALNEENQTALHCAIETETLDIVRLLLNAGADPNLYDDLHFSPLHKACIRNNAEIVKLLLDYEVDINIQNIWGNTPLHYAARHGLPSIVKLLLNHRAIVDLQNSSGHTPLYDVIAYGRGGSSCTQVIEILLNTGANVNAVDDSGDTPLHRAVICHNILCVKILLNTGADVNAVNDSGYTPFSKACTIFDHNDEIIKLLVADIIRVEYCNPDINTRGFRENQSVIDRSQHLTHLRHKCKKELQEMKDIKVSNSGTTLFEILFLEKNLNTLARCISNFDFIANITEKFDMYASFIEQCIKNASDRANLLQHAIESLAETVTLFPDDHVASTPSWNNLPYEVQHMILGHLSNNELRKFQPDDEEEAEITGGYAICD